MSAGRAIGAAIATGIAALALRALDRAQEARAVISAGARESVTIARDSDLVPVKQAWNVPQEGNDAN